VQILASGAPLPHLVTNRETDDRGQGQSAEDLPSLVRRATKDHGVLIGSQQRVVKIAPEQPLGSGSGTRRSRPRRDDL
jgi:hypothetical protein